MKIILFYFSILVPVKNDQTEENEEETTNTFLSASLQQSSSSDSLAQDEIPISEKSKENINQTISTIIPDRERKEIEENELSTPNLSEENKGEEEEQQQPKEEPVSSTPSSGLNPEAPPFFVSSAMQVEHKESQSTGDESDDENESSETAITSGRQYKNIYD